MRCIRWFTSGRVYHGKKSSFIVRTSTAWVILFNVHQYASNIMRQSKIQRYSLCNDVKDKKAAIHHKGRAWTCECFAFSLQTIVTVVNESPNNYALDICPGIKELLYYNTYDSANLLQPILHLDLLQQSYIHNNICVKIIYNSTVQYIPPPRPNSPLYLHQILPTHKYQPPKYVSLFSSRSFH